jgi:hypothetical protein
MKKTIMLFFSGSLSICLSAQVVKTASELNLSNKGLYVGASTSFGFSKTNQNNTNLQSRSLLDVQYRFMNRLSTGLIGGFDYENNSYASYSISRLTVRPELRFWPHKEPQRIMPFLFLNYGLLSETITPVIGTVETNSKWLGAAGAGCTGWLSQHWGLQVRGDILTFRKNEFFLNSQPFYLLQFGVVFKTSKE